MKSLINYALFKEQLKRFWTIAALTALWYILFAVMPLYSMSSNGAMYTANQVIRTISMGNPAVQIMCVVAPFAAVLSMFSYLFQPKSTTAIHSLPINKMQLYCTNIAAIFVLIVIPLIIMSALLLKPVVWSLPEAGIGPDSARYAGYVARLPVELFPTAPAAGAVVNTFPVVAGFFFRTVLTSVFYCALFLTAATVTGAAVVSVLLCAVFPFIPSAMMLLGYITGSFYIFGFEAYQFNDTIMRVLTFSNPSVLGSVFNYYNPVWNEPPLTQANLAQFYFVYIAIAVLLFAVSYWCYRSRKQERAGDSVVFMPLRSFLIFLVSMGGMIVVGALFLGTFKSVYMMYGGFVLGFIIAYIVAQMIAEKTFNVLYKLKDLIKYGGVMAALLAIVVIAARLDVTGYQTYSPQTDEVYGVYLYPRYTMIYGYGGSISEEQESNFYITDEKIIADTLSVHGRIIENRHSLRSSVLRMLEGNRAEADITEQYISFLLKNGEYVTRKYALPQDFAQSSGLSELLSDEAVILSRYTTFKSPERIEGINLDYSLVTEYSDGIERTNYAEPIIIENPGEILSLLEEIKKDIVITERERAKNAKETEVKMKDTISGYVRVPYNYDSWYGDNFTLESFENVDKWLDARGLKPERPAAVK